MSERRFVVKVRGFDSHHVVARTSSAARYATFRALRDAGYYTSRAIQRSDKTPFAVFLSHIDTTLHLGAVQ